MSLTSPAVTVDRSDVRSRLAWWILGVLLLLDAVVCLAADAGSAIGDSVLAGVVNNALYLTAGLLVALLAPPAQANHSWGGYHWARRANPFLLSVGDNVSPAWDAYLDTTVSDWSQSTVLDLTKVPGSSSTRSCKGTTGRVEVDQPVAGVAFVLAKGHLLGRARNDHRGAGQPDDRLTVNVTADYQIDPVQPLQGGQPDDRLVRPRVDMAFDRMMKHQDPQVSLGLPVEIAVHTQ